MEEQILQARPITRDALMEALMRAEKVGILQEAVIEFQRLLHQNLDRLGLGVICLVKEFRDRVEIILLDTGCLVDECGGERLDNYRALGEISISKFKERKIPLSRRSKAPAFGVPPLYCTPPIRHHYE